MSYSTFRWSQAGLPQRMHVLAILESSRTTLPTGSHTSTFILQNTYLRDPHRIPANCAYSSPKQPCEITESSPRPYGLLNSGMVVLTPNLDEFARLKAFIDESPLTSTFLFADQDVLSELFKGRWRPLPYIYNALKTLRVVHASLWRDDDVKCIHYILADKPWKARPKLDGTGSEYEELHKWWWDALELLKEEMTGAGSSEEERKAWAYVENTVARA